MVLPYCSKERPVVINNKLKKAARRQRRAPVSPGVPLLLSRRGVRGVAGYCGDFLTTAAALPALEGPPEPGVRVPTRKYAAAYKGVKQLKKRVPTPSGDARTCTFPPHGRYSPLLLSTEE